MEIKEQIKLRFKGVDFPSVQLQSFKPYKESTQLAPKIDIVPTVFIPKDAKNTFKIIMRVAITVQEYFSLHVTGIGLFELSSEDVDSDTRNSFVNANSTAIMFPYVRAFISSLTSNVGNVTSPIILPTRFFKGDLEHSTEE